MIDRLLRRQRLAHQGYPFAIRRHHQDRSLLRRVGCRQVILERLHVAALLAVEVFGGLDRDLKPQDRLEFLDRLGMRVIDDEDTEPLLQQVRILASRKMESGVERAASSRSSP